MARAVAVLVWTMWFLPSDPGGTGLDTLQQLTTRQTGIFPTDEISGSLVRQGIRRSSTLSNIAAEIEASDVRVLALVVEEPGPWRGFTRFIAAANGVRILSVAVNPRLPLVEQLAALAHELQHAAEIADNPSIVDETSLAREYERIGYRSHSVHGSAFDTKEAVDVGRRVIDELETRSRPVNVARSAS